MDSINPDTAPIRAAAASRGSRIGEFWSTALWGLFIFAAMFVGQIAVVLFFLLGQGGSIDFAAAVHVLGSGVTIALSVITGLPAVIAAIWLAVRFSRASFVDYLALRWTSWPNVAIGVLGLVVVVMGWDLMSRAIGREVAPGFMVDVLNSAREDGAVWLLVMAFCVAAPISEELFARGFLYRGWSRSFLGPAGAIVLSSLVWTGLHLQYDWYFFGEVFTLGLWFGYLRYRSGSTWLTIVLHGLNNLGAVLQTVWLAGHS
jgi:hypothetical protein